MPRILIADDHGLYRKGLRSTLKAAFPKAEIAEAGSLESALIELEGADGNFDLVLVDLNMPGVKSFDSLREARERCPSARFLLITASDARTDVLNCLAARLHGFVSKLQSEDEIVSAVTQVLNGGIYVPSWFAQVGLPGSAGFVSASTSSSSSDYSSTNLQERFAKLTRRQRDVLLLLARGMSNKEIARALNIAEATTKIHAAALCRVLGLRNRIEAAVAARTLWNGVADSSSSVVTEGK
jgi:DNA-binding NarL/FixJ family response regulator